MESKKLGFRAIGEMKPVVGLKNGISTAQCRKRTEWQRNCIGQKASERQQAPRLDHGWTVNMNYCGPRSLKTKLKVRLSK